MTTLLNINNISLNYHTEKTEICAIENISFKVNQNDFISIIGPSGCGKTTLLSLISGLLKPSKGEVVNLSNSSFGYMFQKDNLFEWRTIWQNITLGLEITKNKSSTTLSYAKSLAYKYGLEEFLNRYPDELSGGMRARAALIRTLVLKPDILLLDEPFSALDSQTKEIVMQDVNTIISEEKKTSILVTHNIDEAIILSDRIILLSQRPSKIKREFTSNLRKLQSINERINSEGYKILKNEITKELK